MRAVWGCLHGAMHIASRPTSLSDPRVLYLGKRQSFNDEGEVTRREAEAMWMRRWRACGRVTWLGNARFRGHTGSASEHTSY